MEFFRKLFYLLFGSGPEGGLNGTKSWPDLISYVGTTNIYIVLFAIIFAETGFVVTPFLPGDSLLFAIGAISTRPDVSIDLTTVTILLIIAAVLGNAVNYSIGYRVGPAIFSKETGRLLNKKHLMKAHEFYEKYGGKTIILARFMPIVRTFAPFVAGIARMNYWRFTLFNVIGSVAWVLTCVLSGYYFGQLDWVKRHFELVVVAIVVISLLPMVVAYLRHRVTANKISDTAKM